MENPKKCKPILAPRQRDQNPIKMGGKGPTKNFLNTPNNILEADKMDTSQEIRIRKEKRKKTTKIHSTQQYFNNKLTK